MPGCAWAPSIPTSSRRTTICQLGVLGGYCYLNASLIRLFGERAPGLSWQMMDEQFFGAQPGIPPYEEMPGDVRPDLTEKIGATFAWVFAQHSLDDLTELTDDRVETKALRADRPDLSALDDQQLWERFGEMLPGAPQDVRPAPVHDVHGDRAGRGDQRRGHGRRSARPDHADHLRHRRRRLGSAQPCDVGAVAARARRRTSSPTASPTSSSSSAVVAPTSGRPARRRGRPKPALALVAIDRMRQAPDSADPARQFAIRAEQRAAASAELLAMVAGDPATHGQLAAAIGCSTAWLPGRERTKTNNIRVIHEMRMAMRELGRRMVERGAFDEVEDFGFVREAEMPTLFADPHSLTEAVRSAPRRVPQAPGARAAVRVRRARRRTRHVGPTRRCQCRADVGRRHAGRVPRVPGRGRGHRPGHPRLQRPVRARARRHAGRADHRPVVDAAVRAGGGGGGRCRCSR